MRTTTGKPRLDVILLGDRDLAEAMAEALAAEEEGDRATHGFHTYPAGLHPNAARDLLALFPGESLLDSFCGGGTVLVEGRIAGRRTVGNDLNPTAIRVARTRTATPDDETLTRMRATARRLTEVARKASALPPRHILEPVEKWYAPHVLCELEALRQGVVEAEASVRPYLETVLSSILVKVSWRKSDTSAKRVKHRRPPGTAAVLFHKKTRELARRMIDLRERVPPGTPETRLLCRDTRALKREGPFELVLTSPPYPATYDYLPMQHLRRAWLGDDSRDEERELGARRAWRTGNRKARTRWARDTREWTAAVTRCLSPGGHLVVVIGDGLTPAGEVDASAPTEAAAKAAGLSAVARASLARPDHARGAERWEHVFAFRKGAPRDRPGGPSAKS
jgi:SAM-dependent methyltransferase